jgi:hypothetical protein
MKPLTKEASKERRLVSKYAERSYEIKESAQKINKIKFRITFEQGVDLLWNE